MVRFLTLDPSAQHALGFLDENTPRSPSRQSKVLNCRAVEVTNNEGSYAYGGPAEPSQSPPAANPSLPRPDNPSGSLYVTNPAPDRNHAQR